MGRTVIDVSRMWGAMSLLVASLATGASEAAPTIETPGETPLGAYLAGRHAQQIRDYSAAASWFENALRADPESPELITRTFLMEASEGRFERALALAESELKLDSSDAVAELGLLARGWMRVATGDLAGADAALQELDKFNGLAPFKYYQLGLVYDYAGRADLAQENFNKTLEVSGQLNWRLTEAMANFYERHGRDDQADALYQRFVKDNAGSELAESVLASKPRKPP